MFQVMLRKFSHTFNNSFLFAIFVWMVSIEQLIGDLLIQHNCVIVPSFGGFVAQKKSAIVDFKTGKMLPPSKSLLFNKQLINNDGLLTNELAKSNEQSFDSAFLAINNKVSSWNSTLNSGGRIELDRIGILYRDSEQNLCFEQDRFFNLLMESFGLGQVNFLTEEDVQINERIKVVRELEPTIVPEFTESVRETKSVEEAPIFVHPELKRQRSKTWRYIAAACFLPIAFYSVWIPMKTNVLESGLISFTDFNPFHSSEQATYKQVAVEGVELIVKEKMSVTESIESLPSDVQVYSYKYNDELFIPVQVNESNITEPVEPDSDNNFDVGAMNYIVGCFGEVSNAENLVSKLNNSGLNARILDVKGGLHRVSAGSAFSVEELSHIKQTTQSIGFKGWVLK